MTRTLLTIVDILYYALWGLMLARVVLSWVNIGGYQVRDLVFRLTEPIRAVGLYGLTRQVTTIDLQIDDAARFDATLDHARDS